MERRSVDGRAVAAGRGAAGRGRRWRAPAALVLMLGAVVGSLSWARGGVAAVQFSDPGFVAETVVTLPPFTPIGLTFAPDGRLFIWQKSGVVRIFKNGVLLPVPFIDIQDQVNTNTDRGLLGLALDPGFAENGFVYLLFTYEQNPATPGDPGPKTARLVRVKADPGNPDVALPGSAAVLLGTVGTPPCDNQPDTDCIPADSYTHTIGTVRFAPDGTLLVGTGDGADPGFADPRALRAQSLDSFAGKILRINPDGSAPANNPFNEPGASFTRSRVVSYGLRNPYRFSVDPSGELYVGDVGWYSWEEINRGWGQNFGWPCYEGNDAGNRLVPEFQVFPECQSLSSAVVTPPLHAYPHSVGNSAVTGAYYTGTAYPEPYRGSFFFADYGGEWIKRIVFDSAGDVASVEPFATGVGPGYGGAVSLELGPDGLLYFIAFATGEIRRIRYGGPTAAASAAPISGYAPLPVTFSSAGSAGPGGAPLASYLWNFGDDSPTSSEPNPAHTYVANGTYTATLTVSDGGGLQASATVTVTVGSTPPTPSIAVPAAGNVTPGDVVAFQGSATDEGAPMPASGLWWTVLLHHDTHIHLALETGGTSGSFPVVDHGVGEYAYEVILTATDSTGLSASTSVILPVVLPPNQAPSVDVGEPAGGTVFVNGGPIDIAATASDLDGTVAQVEFFADGVLLGTDITAPYTITWENPLPGSHTLTARATDNRGAATTSAGVEVSVNGPPTVTVISPAQGTVFTAPAAVTVTAAASDPEGSLQRVDFYANGALIGADITAPYSVSWSGIAAGAYVVTAVATDGAGASVTSAGLGIRVDPPGGGGALPSPWFTADIGTVGLAGSATYAGAAFTVGGAGADIWDPVDAFRFVYRALSGDGEIVARVVTQTGTDAWAKAGVMMREGLGTGSRHALMAITPGNGAAFQRRKATDGLSLHTGGAGLVPRWLRLVRTGSTFRGYVSVDGTDWTEIGSDTIDMGAQVLVGLAVTSHNTGLLSTATFDQVSVSASSGTLPSPWQHQDVGAVGLAGTASHSAGAFSVDGSGADIWDAADGFHFVFQPVSGDVQIVARVVSQENTDPWAKAGVMVREFLTPGARHALMAVTPGNGTAFQRRLTENGASGHTAGTGLVPRWLRLVRTGSTFTGATSSDGVTWTQVGTVTIAMGAAIHVGLAVTAHDDTVLATAVFDSVTVTGGGGNVPPTVSLTGPGEGTAYTAPASIVMTGLAADSAGGSVTGVEFLVNGGVVGTDTTAPYDFTWPSAPAGTYQLTARATDDQGATTTSAPVNVTVAGGVLPSPWQHQDVGAVGGLGGAAAYTAGIFTVEGSGADIWDAADGFHFVYQALSGDVEVIARVVTQENTDPWAKAGVMVREFLTPGARHALMAVTPGNGTAFQRRKTENGTSLHTAGTGTVPRWLRVVRNGNTLTGYTSTNGTSWTQVGTDTVTMGATVYVGLAVTAHTVAALSTATFDNVAASGGGGNPPPTVSLTEPADGTTYAAPATVLLTAAAADTGGGSVTQVEFYANGTLIGTDATGPSYSFTWPNVGAGTYQLTARATDDQGAATTSASVGITVTGAGTLPAPWQHQDVGTVLVAGTASHSGGTFTVDGSGADIWDAADGFHFVYQALSGDVEVIARVVTQENTDPWAKAGVMVREFLTPGARHALMAVTPGNGTAFQRRKTENGASLHTAGTGTVPRWLRVVRNGNTLTGYTSTNGTSWTQVGTDTVTMGATVYVGLVVTSHNNPVLSTATFDGVTVTGGAPGNVPPTVSLTEPADGTTYAEPATVLLTADAADTGGGSVTQVEFYANGTPIGTDATGPSYSFTWPNVGAGTYQLTARATDDQGAATTSASVGITVTGASTLPAPWQHQDVGAVGVAGTASHSGGTFTVDGSGADIWDASDEFHFVYQAFAGDVEITARVATQENTNVWAKAGVMIREKLTAGSRHAFALVAPGNGTAFQRRPAEGGASAHTGSTGTVPRWVRLTRTGNTITGYQSGNGTTWTQVGSATITMGAQVYVGLAVTSHADGVLSTATFDNVSVR